jgi:two-component system OmpR family response regulator
MRILLVEDEFGLGDVVTAYLGRTGRKVDWVRSFAEGATAISGHSHELIILDLRLPDGNGLDLVTKLRDSGDVRPLIIVSAHDKIGDRIAGLNAGADDYLVKPFALGELEARLQALQRRSYGRPNPRFEIGNVSIDPLNERVWLGNVEVDLTKGEWLLLKRLCQAAGETVARSDLYEAMLSSAPDEHSGNAVEVYVSRLRKKLGGGVIVNKRGFGYRLAL